MPFGNGVIPFWNGSGDGRVWKTFQPYRECKEQGLKVYNNLRWWKNQTLKSDLRARPMASWFVICYTVSFLEIPEKHKGLVGWSFEPSDLCVWRANKVSLLLMQILFLCGGSRFSLLALHPFWYRDCCKSMKFISNYSPWIAVRACDDWLPSLRCFQMAGVGPVLSLEEYAIGAVGNDGC